MGVGDYDTDDNLIVDGDAPESLKENIQNGYNPELERLPARIRTGRARCPRCGAYTTDIGTCPYCHERIYRPWNPAKPQHEFNVVIRKGWDSETVRVLKEDNQFFESFQMTKGSFDVMAHRNHEGPVNHRVTPRLSSEVPEKERVFRKRKRELFHVVKKAKPCGCGCEVDILDERHGEILCPVCGEVHEKLFILNDNDDNVLNDEDEVE